VEVLPPPVLSQNLTGPLLSETLSLARNDLLRTALDNTHRLRPLDLVYERYSLWSFEGLVFARRRCLPYILEVNNPLRIEQKRGGGLRLDPIARAIEGLLFRSATLVVGASRSVVAYVRSQSGRQETAIVVPNGVNLDRFRPLPPPPPAPFTVGFVGSLEPWHGLEVLLDAFHLLAEGQTRLLIVGDGPLRPWMVQYARKNRLTPYITFRGKVDRTQVPALLGRMHVAVAPYPRRDALHFSPLKVLEYLAAGRAIVASRTSHLADLLSDGRTALLAEPGDPQDLARQIRRLRDDPALRDRLGRAAREEASHCHGWENRVRLVLESLPAHDRPGSQTPDPVLRQARAERAF
jgi:glycosyltransferase involved in cell wall biosynthesis